jgi:peptidyl-prolyl cis-trans isomerase B (cyclophilin B)
MGVRRERDHGVARAAGLPLALAVLALAACGGGDGGDGKSDAGVESECPTSGKQVTFPILDPGRRYSVNVRTNLGAFAFRLNVKDSPCTTSSFASLVRKRFFDGTRFHRIVRGFVIQGGDPTGTGSGGPGYTVVDVPPNNATYTRGVVAMAKTGAEPAGTAGSQFFVVTGRDAQLPPDYALLGDVSSGLDVVLRIGMLGDASEQPTRKVVVQRMTVTP